MAVAAITNICEALPIHWDVARSPLERYVARMKPDGIAHRIRQPRIQTVNATSHCVSATSPSRSRIGAIATTAASPTVPVRATQP